MIKQIYTFEEGYADGGFGSAVAEFYAERGIPARLRIVGAENAFVPHAAAHQQAESAGLSARAFADILEGKEHE